MILHLLWYMKQNYNYQKYTVTTNELENTVQN